MNLFEYTEQQSPSARERQLEQRGGMGEEILDCYGAYPASPGYKAHDTSKLAAQSIKDSTKTLRGKVLRVLERDGPSTADECAAKLGVPIWSIRPRLSELLRFQRVEDSGERRANASGRRAIVWRLAA